MKTLSLVFFLKISTLIFAQSADSYGPCNSYLNILGYYYNFNDLRKDTLKFQSKGAFPAATFIQNKAKLINAEFIDKKGNKIFSGNFKDGNGKLIVEFDNFNRVIYNFINGKLNDTTVKITMNNMQTLYVYNDNILIKEIWYFKNGNPHFIKTFDDGKLNDTLFIFGESKSVFFPVKNLSFYIRTGLIQQIRIYDHGQVKELIWYKKDGSINTQKIMKKTKIYNPEKTNKNCL
jgi:hypothetical protein